MSPLVEDHIRAKLLPVGLGWVNFQVMRRTHASLGHRAKVDPNVAADQFLEQKATAGLSFSIVDHLRWDLTSMFE